MTSCTIEPTELQKKRPHTRYVNVLFFSLLCIVFKELRRARFYFNVQLGRSNVPWGKKSSKKRHKKIARRQGSIADITEQQSWIGCTPRVDQQQVANSERTFPADWITEDGTDVTDDFVRYARPLIGDEMFQLPLQDGRQRLTQFEPVYATAQLPAYVLQTERT